MTRRRKAEVKKEINDDEMFIFSFAEHGLTGTECLEKFLRFKNCDEFYSEIPESERYRLLNAAIKSKPNTTLKCFICERSFISANGYIGHLRKCLESEEIPWKCYRCGYKGTSEESDEHLKNCEIGTRNELIEQKLKYLIENVTSDSLIPQNEESSSREIDLLAGTTRSGKRKSVAKSSKLKYRKEMLNRDRNSVTNLSDQIQFEKTCQKVFNKWREESSKVELCKTLCAIKPVKWKTIPLAKNDQFSTIFTRKSVTLLSEPSEGTETSVPSGIRVNCFDCVKVCGGRKNVEKANVSFCGAPINSIRVAPNRFPNGDDVLCVCTFANNTDLESRSSVVQFWRHRSSAASKPLEVWFLLYLRNRGTVLSMRWLQICREVGELVGFAAFSTSNGEILIYRIDANTIALNETGKGVKIVEEEPHLVLKQLSRTENNEVMEESKIEEDGSIPSIDYTSVPITRFGWCGSSGGKNIVAINACGNILHWNLEDNLETPKIFTDSSWQSPPWDIAIIDAGHVAVGFREKLAKILRIGTWECVMEDGTIKTAGTRVHSDNRLFKSFFTFQSEYVVHPFNYGTNLSYYSLDPSDTDKFAIVPTANLHQLTTWDVAVCPTRGIVVSCGVDGRLIASSNGNLAGDEFRAPSAYASKRVLLGLKRKKIDSLKPLDPFMLELNDVKYEDPSTEIKKTALEKCCVEHEEVCDNMWLEVSFNPSELPNLSRLSSLDQRIDSLNCVDTNTDEKCPIVFAGGEAGLMFALSCSLKVDVSFKEEEDSDDGRS